MSEALFPAAAGRPVPRWLDGLDPRLRILAAAGFALTVLSLQRLPTLAAAVVLALGLARAAGLDWAWLARRLLALEGFMLVLLLSLPFTVPGEPLFAVGNFQASHAGLVMALAILLKANAIVLALLALAGRLEPMVFGHALARLGLPEKLVHLLLATVRQVHLIHAEYRRMDQAMRVRAFVPHSDRHTWNSYGWLIGMLLVRSLARGQRVLGAMRCRGFHGRLYLLDTGVWGRVDTRAALGLAVLLAALAAADRLTAATPWDGNPDPTGTASASLCSCIVTASGFDGRRAWESGLPALTVSAWGGQRA